MSLTLVQMTQPSFYIRAALQPHKRWVDLLEDATTSQELLAVVQDFLATWEPLELAALPAPCHPPAHFFTMEDAVLYAFTVVQYHCGPGAGDENIFRLARFFADVARRVS